MFDPLSCIGTLTPWPRRSILLDVSCCTSRCGRCLRRQAKPKPRSGRRNRRSLPVLSSTGKRNAATVRGRHSLCHPFRCRALWNAPLQPASSRRKPLTLLPVFSDMFESCGTLAVVRPSISGCERLASGSRTVALSAIHFSFPVASDTTSLRTILSPIAITADGAVASHERPR